MKINARKMLVGVGAAMALATTASSADASQLMYYNCGNVGPHAFCAIGFAATPGNAYVRFELNNGAGVSHVACIDSGAHCGNYTTAQDAFSPCWYHPYSTSANGGNDSATTHSYNIAAFTC